MRLIYTTVAIFALMSCGGGGENTEPTPTDVVEPTPDISAVDTVEPDTAPPPIKDPVWTLKAGVPTAVAGKTVSHFGGFMSLGQDRMYFCGDSGLFRVWNDGEWLDMDVSSSATLKDCHAVGDDLMAAVGDDGKFWMWVGADNWLTDDIFDTSPGLRGVHISKATSITAVGVAGSLYRYDGAEWENQTLPDTTGTLWDVWGTAEDNLYAVGDRLLLHYNGTEWVSETMPADPPGTPEGNQGIRARAVAGVDADHVWAVGDQGKVAYRDASGEWSYQDALWYPTAFTGIWTGAADFALIVSAKGQVRRYDGSEWGIVDVATPKKTTTGELWPAEQAVPKGETLDYAGVYAMDSENIFLFSKTGIMLQYNTDY